jgi:hypothetical protein
MLLAVLLLVAEAPFAEDVFFRSVISPYRAKPIAPGYVAESASVSADGKRFVFSHHKKGDIENAELTLVVDGDKLQDIKAPFGWKYSPVIVGDTLLARLGSTAKASKKSVAFGIYALDLNAQAAGWKPWLSGNWVDLALAPGAAQLAMTKTVNERDAIRELWVQPLKDGKQDGAPYQLAKGLRGNLRSPVFSRAGDRVFFVADAGLYAVKNEAGAEAELIDPSVDAPSPVWKSSKQEIEGRDVVYTTRRDKDGRALPGIFSFDLGSKDAKKWIDCVSGVYCTLPVMAPNSGLIWFTARKSDGSAAGVYRTGI